MYAMPMRAMENIAYFGSAEGLQVDHRLGVYGPAPILGKGNQSVKYRESRQDHWRITQ